MGLEPLDVLNRGQNRFETPNSDLRRCVRCFLPSWSTDLNCQRIELSDLPHHALLDARMLGDLFKILASRLVLSL
ncbi:hypothetical protein EQV96_11775 [Pseudomonas sp. TMW22080]|nr:hypothetical protein [Pseudomonas sp. TMW22080]